MPKLRSPLAITVEGAIASPPPWQRGDRHPGTVKTLDEREFDRSTAGSASIRCGADRIREAHKLNIT
ncbi:MAG: hypothetical protein IGR80_08245 [Synechococcales cyanobacterium K44_A2020_017]|nr:hypothetical protein [Synechococcales cyanobacterium K44_A2020_017]